MRLTTFLAQNNISRAEFGARIGASQAAVSRYATGRRIPRPKLMRRIEEETKGHVTANDFFALVEQTEAA